MNKNELEFMLYEIRGCMSGVVKNGKYVSSQQCR